MQATLSHCRILAQIGAAGTGGVVYRAHHQGTLDRNVAKVLPSVALAGGEACLHFRKQAVALSKLNHPNIGLHPRVRQRIAPEHAQINGRADFKQRRFEKEL